MAPHWPIVLSVIPAWCLTPGREEDFDAEWVLFRWAREMGVERPLESGSVVTHSSHTFLSFLKKFID